MTKAFWAFGLHPGVIMVKWSKTFEHDHVLNFKITVVKMVNLTFDREVLPRKSHFGHDHREKSGLSW